jgi:hypothetical protein
MLALHNDFAEHETACYNVSTEISCLSDLFHKHPAMQSHFPRNVFFILCAFVSSLHCSPLNLRFSDRSRTISARRLSIMIRCSMFSSDKASRSALLHFRLLRIHAALRSRSLSALHDSQYLVLI